MANRNAHYFGGFIFAIIAIYLLRLEGITNPIHINILFALISTISSRGPDILEAPINPNHRGFFHSVIVFLLLFVGLIYYTKINPPSTYQEIALLFIGWGYFSHLVLDLPGLPIIH
jgi:membrane-bound metal-dependent hydrolase YbcI (DUF457 family)